MIQLFSEIEKNDKIIVELKNSCKYDPNKTYIIPAKSAAFYSGYKYRKIQTSKQKNFDVDSGIILSIYGCESGEIIDKIRYEIAGFVKGSLWIINQQNPWKCNQIIFITHIFRSF